MRWKTACFVCVLFMANAVAHGQPLPDGREAPRGLSNKQTLELLKHGVEIYSTLDETRTTRGYFARVELRDLQTCKAIDVLREVKELWDIEIVIIDQRYAEECIARIADLPSLKRLAVEGRLVSEGVLARIVTLKKLERLSLACRGLSAAQIRQIQTMKGLKSVHLACLELPPKTLDDLKNALPQADIMLEPTFAFRFYEPLTTAANDDMLLKLQKQKFNAAVAAINDVVQQAASRKLCYSPLSGAQFGVLGNNLRNAAAELDDPVLLMKAAKDYLVLVEFAFQRAEERFNAGQEDPVAHELSRYQYLDAQIFLLKLQKKKTP